MRTNLLKKFNSPSCKRETYMIEFKPPDGKGRMHIRQREKREREEEKEEGSK
jgi:hypothetical protein